MNSDYTTGQDSGSKRGVGRDGRVPGALEAWSPKSFAVEPGAPRISIPVALII